MANNLFNTVSNVNYSYTVHDLTTGTGTATGPSTQSEVTAANITFTKEVSPTYAKLTDTVTLTYKVTNNTGGTLTSGTIEDSLFNVGTFTSVTVSGGSITAGVLTIDPLPADTAEATITVGFTIGSTTNLSSTYSTTATAKFANSQSSDIERTAFATFEINTAILAVTKTVSPTTPIVEGNQVQYTITFTNTGNVDAIVEIGGFVDTWTAKAISGATVNDTTNFSVNQTTNTLSNIQKLTIPNGTPKVITVTGIARVPS